MVFIVLDAETSGLSKRPLSDLNKPQSVNSAGDSVVQLGALVYNSSFELQRAVCLYNNIIQADVSPKAQEVNKLSMALLRDTLYSVTLEQNIVERLPELLSSDVCVVGYNVNFDFVMIAQTIRNFTTMPEFRKHNRLEAPKKGKCLVDVAEYCAASTMDKRIYKKLTQVSSPYAQPIADLFYEVQRKVYTNCPAEFKRSGHGAHSALYDAVATSVLWREKVCPTWI